MHVLDDAGLLDKVVIIGRWSVYLYQQAAKTTEVQAFKTRDIDVLLPPRVNTTVNLTSALAAQGFILQTDPINGCSLYSHPDVDIEFLTTERGAGSNRPVSYPTLGITAQGLRYLGFLLEETILVSYAGLVVRIPKPEAYLLHKMLILDRRHKEDKRESDIATVQGLMEIVRNSAEKHKNLIALFDSFPGGWHKTIGKNSKDYVPEFLELLKQPKGNA